MAASNTPFLPLYNRYINGVSFAASRKIYRTREKCFILMILLTFGLISIGTFYSLPELRTVSSPVDTVYKAYKHIQSAGPDLLIPAPPLLEENKDNVAPRPFDPRHSVMNLESRIERDRNILMAKIEEEKKNQKVLEKPDISRSKASSIFKLDGDKNLYDDPSYVSEKLNPNDVSKYPIIEHTEGDRELLERRNKIKQMMKHAWDNYVTYAWGSNELKPISKKGHNHSVFGSAKMGATIVDGLDTLYIMGMEKEFNMARDWVAENLDLSHIDLDMSVFETNIRFVGGLLSCYSLTGDTMFRDKAEHVANKLLPAFQTPTGIPYALVNFKTGNSKNYGWASGGCSILSEFGTLHLEFNYLSDVTGNPIYREKVEHVRQILKRMEKPKGLYPNYIHPRTGKWGQHHMSLGGLGDSFYEYLLKSWIQSGYKDTEAKEMFVDAMNAVTQNMLQTSPGGLLYLAEIKFERVEHKMGALACFAGGLYGLASDTLGQSTKDKYMNIAKGITNTCHEAYDRSATKLAPESFMFSDVVEAKAIKSGDKYYILRPETVESYFVLWRLTKDPKYREWGWNVVQALETHCKSEGGYSGIKNVYAKDNVVNDDVQQSYFLAEMLKYLYLLYSDDSVIPMDKWVFNSEAHPLPIKEYNDKYYRAWRST